MTQAPTYDVCAVGNAIVDVLAPSDAAFLDAQGLTAGSMQLVDAARSAALYEAMAAGVEASGGSAGNTVAGVGSFGGRAAYIGKVADDQLGGVFSHDIRAAGVHFETAPLRNGAASGLATGVCMINVTPDGQRTMCTFLGAANQLEAADIDAALIGASAIVYLEGYLFDPAPARAAFEAAAAAAHAAGRKVAITLSDSFVVHRWRAELLAFIEASADIVLANEAELTALFETDDFDAAAARLASIVEVAAVTRGAEGSVVLSGDEQVAVAAFPVDKVVDTTGAGDQYAAGFLLGLSRGLTLEEAGRLGSLAASEVIAHWGPRPMTPLRELAQSAGLTLGG
ncbi:sugar/nucleoside kinase (ribokinase family) [Brevundimonas alba]|uniref:Sugar/nucleoside kinase (Ribokinase family) n=1 Tax=Brevundimonas alba TaxID=74314 RepID=A0A7X6BNK2_9CAUL|nr:adenosine kinase [Brevundimonas alba]NJC40820.1 sugar/nucleoside kinase (ribokinase family) [Brevundimonas alba]